MSKEKTLQYPLKLKEGLMEKARSKAKEEDISFNQWLRDAVKEKLKTT